jgi:hypothetical protein
MVGYCWPRRSRFETWQYYRVRAAAAEIADIVGYPAPRPVFERAWRMAVAAEIRCPLIVKS